MSAPRHPPALFNRRLRLPAPPAGPASLLRLPNPLGATSLERLEADRKAALERKSAGRRP